MKKKIAIIGLGDISQKAYLPYYASLQDKYDFIISSRDVHKSEAIREKYAFYGAVEGIQSLIEEKIDAAFVHSATSSHFELCEKLLKAGIHVYVDKPVSENLSEVAKLQQLSMDEKVLFMAGFNRRFAPMVQKLKDVPKKNMLFVNKNRSGDYERPIRCALYDLFIHPLDTALYLLDDDVEKIRAKMYRENGKLNRVFVRLETKTATAIVTTNFQSGANQENYEVQSETGTYRLENLTELYKDESGVKTKETFNDWTNTLEKRGFIPMVDRFLESVKTIGNTGDYIKAMVNCNQTKVYKSHEIIEDILKSYEIN